jgi:Flp pilus assembly protein TadD
MMSVADTCPSCKASFTANAPAGLCPRCLLRLGLGADLSAEPAGAVEPGRPATGMLERDYHLLRSLSGATQQSRNLGVLDALDEAVGPVPRVLLRDSPVEDPSPVRPGLREMADLAGDTGRYDLLGEIARGGMGAVLEGRDVDLGRNLAVKVLLEEHRDHPEMVRRFVEEAQIGGQLQHPGIVPVYELGQLPDRRLYIAMKLVKGRTLAALLEARKDPTEDRARCLSVFEQVCQTMAYAHSRGVIHRDLKPSNVMVGGFGEVQVMDWGLAKVLDQGGVAVDERSRRDRERGSGAIRTVRTGSDAGDSRAGSVLGTPAYMAPEQARGELDTVDERADVFGLGSILCEILTGRPAYTGQTSVELCRQAEHAELADALARLDACGADGELVALARSCLAAAPKDRPRDAGVVAAGLTAYLAGVEQRLRAVGLAQAKAEARAAEERKRLLLRVWLAAALLVIALLGGGGWSWVVRDRAARVEATTGEINKALYDVRVKLDQARSAPGGESAKWDAATEAAQRAMALLARSEGRAGLRARVQGLLAAIESEHRDVKAKAEAAVKDRSMVERLAGILADLAIHTDRAKADAQYAAAFRSYGVDLDALGPVEAGVRLAARPVANELAEALDQWTFVRRHMNPPDVAGAQHLVAVAKAADPDPWRNRLRDALELASTDKGRALDALRQLAATADLDSLPGANVVRLTLALSWLGHGETAVSLLRRAQRSHPDDSYVNWDLGNHLMRAGQLDEAIRFYSVAVAIRPRSDLAVNLATALHRKGQLEDAEATFREAIRFRADNATAHVGLGAVLMDLNQSGKAEDEFAEAKRLKPDDWWIRNAIARVLMDHGDWAAATAQLREAVRHEPGNAFAHDSLGMALFEMGQIDDAMASYREAVRLAPGFVPAQGHLGRALLARGELAAALESFRQANHPGSAETSRGFPSAAMEREGERMVALDARLPALLRGEDKPADAAECAEFARLCHIKHLYATSARLWSEAFAARPELADRMRAGNRFNAACSAAMAGCGSGKDDPPPDAAARQRWRRQALDWLKADLAVYAKRLESGTPQERAGLPRRLALWWFETDLAGLRDEAALGRLAGPERQAWEALWSEVEALQKRIERSTQATAPLHPF